MLAAMQIHHFDFLFDFLADFVFFYYVLFLVTFWRLGVTFIMRVLVWSIRLFKIMGLLLRWSLSFNGKFRGIIIRKLSSFFLSILFFAPVWLSPRVEYYEIEQILQNYLENFFYFLKFCSSKCFLIILNFL